MIRAVQAGSDLKGTTLRVTGVALADNDPDGFVVIGTEATYRSGDYVNFVEVNEVRRPIRKGEVLTAKVEVTLNFRSELVVMGQVIVVIHTTVVE